MASLFIRSPIPVYEKELEFPCCQKASDEIVTKLGVKDPSPEKVPASSITQEDTKSDTKSDDRSSNEAGC